MAGALAGCAAGPGEFAVPTYPAEVAARPPQDIQADRRGTNLVLTNTSGTDYAEVMLWLNREFARPIESFPIGAKIELPLASFRNEFGERFRAGGFFATQPPANVVSAEIHTPEGYVPLVVTNGDVEFIDPGTGNRPRATRRRF